MLSQKRKLSQSQISTDRLVDNVFKSQEKKLKEVINVVSEQSTENADLETEKKNLETKIAGAQAEKEKLEAEIEESKATIVSLREEVNLLKSKYSKSSKAKKELNLLQTKLRTAEEKLQNLEQEKLDEAKLEKQYKFPPELPEYLNQLFSKDISPSTTELLIDIAHYVKLLLEAKIDSTKPWESALEELRKKMSYDDKIAISNACYEYPPENKEAMDVEVKKEEDLELETSSLEETVGAHEYLLKVCKQKLNGIYSALKYVTEKSDNYQTQVPNEKGIEILTALRKR